MLFILAAACTTKGQTAKPDGLIAIIKEQQATFVRESCSPEGCCCFTWMSLNSFKQDKTLQRVAQNLRADTNALAIVGLVTEMMK